MKLLAIDTAGVDCSAAVYDVYEQRLLGLVSERIGKGHAERLMDMVSDALSQAGLALDAMERVAVTIGPGSFTGIRVGVAAARGFALALGVEAVGVSTLHVLASAYLERGAFQPVIAAMDAKRSEIYAQGFSADGTSLFEPCSVSLDELRNLVAQHGAAVTGSAAALLEGAEKSEEPDRFDIALVAKLGALANPARDIAKPLYLRGPDAKPQDGFALARA